MRLPPPPPPSQRDINISLLLPLETLKSLYYILCTGIPQAMFVFRLASCIALLLWLLNGWCVCFCVSVVVWLSSDV